MLMMVLCLSAHLYELFLVLLPHVHVLVPRLEEGLERDARLQADRILKRETDAVSTSQALGS